LHGITDEVRPVAPQPDISHRVAPAVEPSDQIDTPRPSAPERDSAAPDNQERHSPPPSDMSELVGLIKEENRFLREQIGVKEMQIAALLERDKETNFSIRGLQTMLAPLLGRRAVATGPATKIAPQNARPTNEALNEGFFISTSPISFTIYPTSAG
jgi:hypothetical protein